MQSQLHTLKSRKMNFGEQVITHKPLWTKEEEASLTQAVSLTLKLCTMRMLSSCAYVCYAELRVHVR